jgi:predicted nucleic acid-binding protein
MIVVDASAILEILLNTPASPRVWDRLSRSRESLHAPHILDLEVVQVLRRYALAGELDPFRASETLQNFGELPITRYSHEPLLPRIWDLRHNFTAYDSAYLSLAEILDAPLLTRDAAFTNAKGHAAVVELI